MTLARTHPFNKRGAGIPAPVRVSIIRVAGGIKPFGRESFRAMYEELERP